MNLPQPTTPEQLADLLGWSEEYVRRRARELGACRILGKKMIFLPEDVEIMRRTIGAKGRRPTDYGVVYFIRSREFIKIGWSQNWERRLAGIQTHNPEQLEPLLVLSRPKIFEKTMHRQFAAHRHSREWFKDCPEIREYIAERESECMLRKCSR